MACGTISPSILLDRQLENQIEYFSADKHIKYLHLRVNPYVESYLNRGLLSIRRRWMMKYRCNIKITSDQSLGFVETKILDRKGRELD